ncbi:MAG: glycoside hydrolase family 3 protein [Termitinemataceae bacterium]|nr:MAG: glycoside hydrolase family 3 protein [Termitinemataceae bacterium]
MRFIALLSCTIFFCTSLYPLSFKDDLPPQELSVSIVAAMSDADLLAQVFMFGWRDIGNGPSLLIQEWITRRHIGSVKVFGWNTSDTMQLARNIATMQRIASAQPYSLPLFVATDQEGGLVRHVKGDTAQTPGAMAIGASGFPQDAYLSGYFIGKELSIIGINMNFAPSVDLYTNHNSVLIGPRSFGDDPVKAGIMGIAFSKGMLQSGVIPTAKHFPGHGDTEKDSHGTLPVIQADFDTLWDRELVPYRMMSAEGIPAIMSGHIAFPNTSAQHVSASLSPFFLQDILRTKIGFKGLVITDDLMMNGATASTGSLWRTAKAALLAGNDVLLMSSTPEFDDPIWTNLLAAMRDEPLFKARVVDAATLVIATKLKYLRGGNAVPPIPNLEKVRTDLPDKEGKLFFQDLAVRSVTTVKENQSLLPLSKNTTKKIFLAGQSLDFFAQGKKIFSDVASYWYSAPVTEDLMRRAAASDIIIFYLKDAEGIDVLKSFRPLGKKIIVLSVLSPAYLEQVMWIDAALAVYSDSPESISAGFSAIVGNIPAHGTVPFVLKN